jgi:hypothetical protein
MITLTALLIDALWILGLAGLFATFSYIDYYRHLHCWRWRDAWKTPRLLTPLNLSLTVFSFGLALNGATGQPPAPVWELALWSAISVAFAWQTILYWRIGQRQGWDLAIDGRAFTEDAKCATAESSEEKVRGEQSR